MKYLIILAVVLVVFWIWRAGRDSAQQAMRERRRETERERSAPTGQPPRIEMVRCPVCGVHLPEAEAVRANATYYCSVEHLNQAERG